MRRLRRAAFSIVELLAVMGILMILAALLMLALSGVRAEARRRVCQSEMHQLSTMIFAYCVDSRDLLPFPLEPTGDGNWRYVRSGRVVPPIGALGASHYWPVAMFNEFGDSMYSDVLLCPDDVLSLASRAEMAAQAGVPEQEVQGPAVRGLSMSCYVDPAALTAPRTTWEDWFFRVNALHDVTFASQKALLVETEPFHDADYFPNQWDLDTFRLMVAAMDGSVEWRRGADATPGVRLPIDRAYGLDPDSVDMRLGPFQLCKDGVRGRDW
ncbi:MAG: hypothetical protein KJZ65_09290 [Phycisphaerales bacterium]|nr:hypothetical protein [Phycisphaerales bacterium]